jgi:riboflavin kinase/FMN adenylyltransferase
MQVHFDLQNLPSFDNAAITIGTFDGVHIGHKKVIEALIEEAIKLKGESIIITFHPHPRKIVNADTPLQLINTLEEKIELIRQTGVDHIVVVPFTNEFANQTAKEYIENFLVKNFNPRTIIIGHDHHFGKNREGNIELLQQLEPTYNFTLLEIPKHVVDEIAISSSKIRNALLKSEIDTANKLLGYPFFFEGKVVAGDALGRTIGFPTANLDYTNDDKIRLRHGVYAVMVEVENRIFKGMLSIGTRPVLKNSPEKIEVHILDFQEDIYDKTIRINVVHWLRSQQKFNSLQEMQTQLEADRENAKKLLLNYS